MTFLAFNSHHYVKLMAVTSYNTSAQDQCTVTCWEKQDGECLYVGFFNILSKFSYAIFFSAYAR